MAACPSLHPLSTSTWLACGFLSLALLHLLCCSPPATQDAVFTPLLQYVNATYSYLSSGGGQSCEYSEGRWVWAPGHVRRYNATACGVKEGQDCLRNGRPDTGYLDWRWQPAAGCRLPAFDAAAFLAAVRGKHVSFVGDSMARNQAESLACLLSAAFPRRVVHRDPEAHRHQFMRWAFPTHDVTVSVYWAPYLARATGKSENYSMPYNLVYLDAPADRWAADADTMDVVVLSAGHWLLNSAVYHNGSEVVGVHAHPELNHTDIGYASPFRQAYRMSLERLSSGRPRTVVLTTFSPTHFENNRMDDPTACAKKAPYKEGEKELNRLEKELRSIVIEEAEAAAQRNGTSGAVRFEVLDVTKLAAMRPDGHPGPYMNRDPFAHGVLERMQTDCLHFCLPGPVDTFNEILQQILTKRR
ncbi:Protein ALTERED XYLOGLUCAN 4 [Dichanthelium oligosanthes]|uniref:Protein ALTERED XYLOGLUCAN 4 n=1 Tax=Dichanthelium oligosanthes TaxID=888268 RepID=A0A1E5VWK0_9POAL|nr:Protein ALTERED XYLOGLUCAN 4 [Dichanthelium oligosanthes]